MMNLFIWSRSIQKQVNGAASWNNTLHFVGETQPIPQCYKIYSWHSSILAMSNIFRHQVKLFLLWSCSVSASLSLIILCHDSRNQLSVLPANLCKLPLQVLLVNHNRLVSLPEEINQLSGLLELDASCNQLSHLPIQLGELQHLQVLNLRKNFLVELPKGSNQAHYFVNFY